MAAISSQRSNGEEIVTFALKWTPRAIAVAIGGYYGLGMAYEFGLLALVDQLAIQAIKHLAGYAGVGALMPTVQWYSAWGLRIVLGLVTGLVYDFIETKVKACWSWASEQRAVPN